MYGAMEADGNVPIGQAYQGCAEKGRARARRKPLCSSAHLCVHAIEGGVPLNVIADNCGTSVRMIEKTYAKILAEKRRDFIERGTPSLAESRLQ